MAGKKGSLIIFLLLLLPASAIARDFAVSIEPKDFNGTPEIYKDEIITYQVKAINFGRENITGLHVELNVGDELSIIDSEAQNENNTERQKKVFTVEQVKPGEIILIEFLLKAKAEKSEKAIVSANYGLLEYTNSVIAFLDIVPGNVIVSVSPKQPSFAPSEDNSLFLSISNNSPAAISGIRAVLVLPRDFESDSNTIILPDLETGKKTENNEFSFAAKELAQGKRRVALLVSFTDEKGAHTLDKAVTVDVKSSSIAILAVAIAVAVIVGIMFFPRKGGNGKSQNKAEKPKEKANS